MTERRYGISLSRWTVGRYVKSGACGAKNHVAAPWNAIRRGCGTGLCRIGTVWGEKGKTPVFRNALYP